MNPMFALAAIGAYFMTQQKSGGSGRRRSRTRRKSILLAYTPRPRYRRYSMRWRGRS